MRAWSEKSECVSLQIPASAKIWLVRIRLQGKGVPHKVDGRSLVVPVAYKTQGADAVDLARYAARRWT